MNIDGGWKRNVHTMKDPTKEQGVSLVNGAPVGEIREGSSNEVLNMISIFDVILKPIQ